MDIKQELYLATEASEVEAVFEKYNIESVKEKIDFLMQAMEAEELHPPADQNLEDDYSFLLAAFLEGTWRLM